jgi:hypothetical protein
VGQDILERVYEKGCGVRRASASGPGMRLATSGPRVRLRRPLGYDV